jgi:hypothetical protein
MDATTQLARMQVEGLRLWRLGLPGAAADLLPAAAAARDWPLLSLCLQLVSLCATAARRVPVEAERYEAAAVLAAPRGPQHAPLLHTLWLLVAETQEHIPKGFPFKKVHTPHAHACTARQGESESERARARERDRERETAHV